MKYTTFAPNIFRALIIKWAADLLPEYTDSDIYSDVGYFHVRGYLYRTASLSGQAPVQLRQYQTRVLQQLADGKNRILVLPTGGGKTEVALQHTLALLQADPSTKTVFVVPNIVLATQQAGTAIPIACPLRSKEHSLIAALHTF